MYTGQVMCAMFYHGQVLSNIDYICTYPLRADPGKRIVRLCYLFTQFIPKSTYYSKYINYALGQLDLISITMCV